MKFSTAHICIFQWTELSRIEFETQIGFQALRMLIKTQEESLTNIRQKFQEQVKNDEDLKNLSPEEKGSYYSQIFEIEEQIINELARQQRYSSCQNIFSFFEGQLESLCNLIEKSHSFRIKLSDLNKQDNLMYYWNFLHKVFGIDIQEIEPFFTPIKQHKTIRNKIAHQNGIITEKIRKSFADTKGILFNNFEDEFQITIIDSSYSIYLIDKMELLLKKLIILIDKRHQSLL